MLSGKLVRLRAVEPSDAQALARWTSDPEVGRWMINDYPWSLAQTIKRCEERPKNTYDNVVLCIETLAEKRPIGIVALLGAEPESGRPELSIYIGESEFRGGGYGTDALRVICRYGFDQMRLHGITLWVVAEHVVARHVSGKVGFVEEGRSRERFFRDGRWHDMILMSVLEGELKE